MCRYDQSYRHGSNDRLYPNTRWHARTRPGSWLSPLRPRGPHQKLLERAGSEEAARTKVLRLLPRQKVPRHVADGDVIVEVQRWVAVCQIVDVPIDLIPPLLQLLTGKLLHAETCFVRAEKSFAA